MTTKIKKVLWSVLIPILLAAALGADHLRISAYRDSIRTERLESFKVEREWADARFVTHRELAAELRLINLKLNLILSARGIPIPEGEENER